MPDNNESPVVYNSPKNATVKGMWSTLFEDGPNPIYLLPDGRFGVLVDGKWEAKPTLVAIMKCASKGRPSLKVFREYDTRRGVREAKDICIEIVEITPSSMRATDGRRHSYMGHVCVWDESIVTELLRIEREETEIVEAARQKAQKARSELYSFLKMVCPSNFNALAE